MNKGFFLEITNMIESKMAATAGLKVFNVQSVWPYWTGQWMAFSWKLITWLNPNYAWWSWIIPYIFMWIANTRCLSWQDNYTFDPMDNFFWNNSLMKAILAGMFLGWCSTKYLFFVRIVNLRLLPWQDKILAKGLI